MNGKPDYDAGDLIVAIGNSRKYPIRDGQVFVCERLYAPEEVNAVKWGVVLRGLKARNGTGCFVATKFRKLTKKSQEFFTGEDQRVPTDREMV